MQGLRRSGSRTFSQYLVCLCPRLRTLNHPNFTLSNKPMGWIQRQDPNLQRKLNTDLSGLAAVVLCPRRLQWNFVYSQISVLPLTPRQTEIRFRFPSHWVLQVPLCQSQTTPYYTCRSSTLEKRPHLPPKSDDLPSFPSPKAGKWLQMRNLRYFKWTFTWAEYLLSLRYWLTPRASLWRRAAQVQ